MADALKTTGWTFKAERLSNPHCVRMTPRAGPLAGVELAIWSFAQAPSVPDEIPVAGRTPGVYRYVAVEGILEWCPQ